jgi:metallo-beta-lactamase class B
MNMIGAGSNMRILSNIALVIALVSSAAAQELPKGVTAADLATNNKLFLELATKALKWEEPAEPVKIAGPINFVGTKGLGAFLITTTEGHILMNTGMPSSGPMIVDSIRKLGFAPADITLMINGHAHIDHAGAFAHMKQHAPNAVIAVMREDVAAMESGDRNDFKYADDFVFPGVKVDRVLRDGDTLKMGAVLLTAYNTPGHTRGATTWVLETAIDGKPFVVVFPDGAGFNPGYRLVKDPIYPGIAEDFRRTHHALEMLKPDIWLAQHNEYYDLEGKRERAKTEGMAAWIDPEGYRRFIAAKKRAFEAQVDLELGVPTPAAPVSPSETPTPATEPAAAGGTVTLSTFVRAETDRYFAQAAREGAFGVLRHRRTLAAIDAQDVVRMNRDTLYSSGVFDLGAAPLTVTLPEVGPRFMSMQVISQDHYTADVVYAPGRFTYDRKKVGTRYAYVIVRTLVDADDSRDLAAAHALQDRIDTRQERKGTFEIPEWDTASLDRAREAISSLSPFGVPRAKFGRKGEVDPVAHLIGTAIGWGGNPDTAAMYVSAYPRANDGNTAYTLTLRDVPVDGFWSISVYNEKGFFEKNAQNTYSLNSLAAQPGGDGSVTVRFGGCDASAVNCLPIMPGWNYTVRLYRPRQALLDGTWKLPEAQPVSAR